MKRMLLLVIAICMISTGCVKISEIIDDTGKEVPTDILPNEKPITGGKLTIASVEPASLNPLYNTYETYDMVIRLIFEGLFQLDETFKPVPILATGYEFKSNNKLLIQLRTDKTWSDGTAFTAEDVAFTLSTIRANANSVYSYNIKNIKSWKVMGKNTIELALHNQTYNMIPELSFPIIPKHIYSKEKNPTPIGTGPYKISQYDKGKSIELIPNSKQYITNISVIFINDAETFETAFRTKAIDIIGVNSFDWEKYMEQKDVVAYGYETTNLEYMALNHKQGLLKNKEFRQAISSAIDKETMVKRHLFEKATVTNTPIQPKSWLMNGQEVRNSYDESKAISLLDGLGYVDTNNDKMRELPEKLVLTTNKDNINRVTIAGEIEKSLEKVGIPVEIELVDAETLIRKYKTNDYDMILMGYNISNSVDLKAILSAQTSYVNETLDKVLEDIQNTTDEDTLKYLYKQVIHTVEEEVPIVSLFFRQSAMVTRDKIGGEIKPRYGNVFYQIENWYLRK